MITTTKPSRARKNNPRANLDTLGADSRTVRLNPPIAQMIIAITHTKIHPNVVMLLPFQTGTAPCYFLKLKA
jgi:hypothetical protein